MTIQDIIKEWLKDHGHDGLVHPETTCGCGIDGLFPCGEYFNVDCEAAYNRKCAVCTEDKDKCSVREDYGDETKECYHVSKSNP